MTAHWVKMLLKTVFYLLQAIFVCNKNGNEEVLIVNNRTMNFESFTALKIEDEPSELPVQYYENAKPFNNENLNDELLKILTPKNDWPYPTINTYHDAYLYIV